MAKKKTENIKAAPVLRASGGGVDPAPVTPTITKSYSVRDDWKDINKVNYVAFKSVDGEVQDLTVNGQPAGGGGGGDFSTAQVTIDNSNNHGGYPEIYGSIIDNYNAGGLPPTPVDCTGGYIAPSDPIQTYTVILYKGKAKLFVNASASSHTITVSGNGTHIRDKSYVFTGNGTITIS